jgi:hypothetical protein
MMISRQSSHFSLPPINNPKAMDNRLLDEDFIKSKLRRYARYLK